MQLNKAELQFLLFLLSMARPMLDGPELIECDAFIKRVQDYRQEN